MCTVIRNQLTNSKNPLTKSLEKLLEDAHLSGELVLSGRKLKDFPKLGSKYQLHDLVIADLSRNKFNEVPEDVTKLMFVEKLDFSNNVIRSIPDTINGLKSLTFLDLSRNQLSSLPRELCQLPIQIFVISHNRLTSLPDEIGRMTSLSELDASNNQLTHLPQHLSNLTQLRSLILRNNQLLCLPVELTYLQLVRLDLQANKIATLPLELRVATTLQVLIVDDNPLTSPPLSLCKRGRVHIFKYLEQEAVKSGIEPMGRRSRRATTTVSIPTSVLNLQKASKLNESLNQLNVITNGENGSQNVCDEEDKVQTYREYKEALKQQRAQDLSHIYRKNVNSGVITKSENEAVVIGDVPNVPVTYANNNCDNIVTQFTLKREFNRAKEESDLVRRLRNIIETRFKTTLPDDLAPALSDGVILCHLVNQIQPQSVASIHIPSSTVPKLTMARCRRNVDNFLEACRKLGLDEGLILATTDDIIFALLNHDEEALKRLLHTIEMLIVQTSRPITSPIQKTVIKNGFSKINKLPPTSPPPLPPVTVPVLRRTGKATAVVTPSSSTTVPAIYNNNMKGRNLVQLAILVRELMLVTQGQQMSIDQSQYYIDMQILTPLPPPPVPPPPPTPPPRKYYEPSLI